MFSTPAPHSYICKVIDVLINYVEGIFPQCMLISNHNVHSKYLTIFYVHYTSVKLKIFLKEQIKPKGNHKNNRKNFKIENKTKSDEKIIENIKSINKPKKKLFLNLHFCFDSS